MTVQPLIPSGFELHVTAAEFKIIRRALAAPRTLGDPGLTARPAGAVKLDWNESDVTAEDVAAIYGRKG